MSQLRVSVRVVTRRVRGLGLIRHERYLEMPAECSKHIAPKEREADVGNFHNPEFTAESEPRSFPGLPGEAKLSREKGQL